MKNIQLNKEILEETVKYCLTYDDEVVDYPLIEGIKQLKEGLI